MTSETIGAGRPGQRKGQLFGLLILVVLGVAAVALWGTEDQDTPGPSGTDPTEVELTGEGLILQTGGEPFLCLGAVAETSPPQCSGPTLRYAADLPGEFSWDSIAHTKESNPEESNPEESDTNGVARWTDDPYTVRGFYDPDDGPFGSFTLSAPVVQAPLEAPHERELPELCTDPERGANPALIGRDAREQLEAESAKLPLVHTWVSGDQDAFNFLVQDDPEVAHAQLRTVWGGALCVESSEAPTQEERTAALDRISEALPARDFLGGATNLGAEPVVQIRIVTHGPATREAITTAAEGVEVQVVSALTPVGEDPAIAVN